MGAATAFQKDREKGVKCPCRAAGKYHRSLKEKSNKEGEFTEEEG